MLLQSKLPEELGRASSRCKGLCTREPGMEGQHRGPGTVPSGKGWVGGRRLGSLLVNLPLPRTGFLKVDASGRVQPLFFPRPAWPPTVSTPTPCSELGRTLGFPVLAKPVL